MAIKGIEMSLGKYLGVHMLVGTMMFCGGAVFGVALTLTIVEERHGAVRHYRQHPPARLEHIRYIAPEEREAQWKF